jgi:aminoglycoside phosphotransferase (APT) family kinase protein
MATIDRQALFSGTKDVAQPLRFDSSRLEAYLAAHLNGFSSPLTVRQFKGGQSNPTYLLDTPARRYVLRRKPPGKLLPSAHAVDREFRIISALYAQGFPVAAPLHYCADETVVGTAFYVMAYVDGRVFWEPHMPGSNPTERAVVYDAMNATLARLHSFAPAAIDLADFGRAENYVTRQVERWSKQYRTSQTEAIEEMERLMEWLPGHIPPAGPARIVHGDYRLDNIIIAADSPNVVAVLDWELSTLGDPLADFTYHLMQWHMPPDQGTGVGSLLGCDLRAIGVPSAADYISSYVARTGLDPRPHLPVYLAYNFFRFATAPQPANTRRCGRKWCGRSRSRPGRLHVRRGHIEEDCPCAWRRRGTRSCAHRRAGGARRSRRQAGGDRRQFRRRLDRRSLCRRHDGEGHPSLRLVAGA